MIVESEHEKLKKIKTVQPEKIIWDDAGSFRAHEDASTWFTIEEIQESYADATFMVTTYGRVIWENENDIIVAQNTAIAKELDQEQYSNCLRIPKCLIVERIKLPYNFYDNYDNNDDKKNKN